MRSERIEIERAEILRLRALLPEDIAEFRLRLGKSLDEEGEFNPRVLSVKDKMLEMATDTVARSVSSTLKTPKDIDQEKEEVLHQVFVLTRRSLAIICLWAGV